MNRESVVLLRYLRPKAMRLLFLSCETKVGGRFVLIFFFLGEFSVLNDEAVFFSGDYTIVLFQFGPV